jgi:phosphoribosyl 1,2-cyclic phosphodiesterase
MEFCVLASGSKGNCTYVTDGETAFLVDIGLSAREIVARLEAAQIDPATIQAIIFSHDHVDHYRGAEVFSKKFSVRLLANEGTASGIDRAFPKGKLNWEIFETASSFDLGRLHIDAFSVPHDASDPVGFIITEGNGKLGIVTDLGQPTPLIINKLSSCDAIVLESNHDYDMLMASNRPWPLKTRIAGRSGHLSNVQANELLQQVLSDRLRLLLLAHLSEECNTHYLAQCLMRETAASCRRPDIIIESLQQKTISARYRI